MFFGGPSINRASASLDAIPAAEGAGTFGFEVERGAERDYTFNLEGQVSAESSRYLDARESTLSGANKAILTVIQPPWLVPSTNAFFTPKTSITCRFMIAVSQYVKFSDLVRV